MARGRLGLRSLLFARAAGKMLGEAETRGGQGWGGLL